jgi:phenylacetate-CoA ligase
VRPVQIIAYVESLRLLADFAETNGIALHRPHCVVTTAGTLTEHARDTIGRVFRAPVLNRYGSIEMGDIAAELVPRGGMMVAAPTHIVEILRPDGSAADIGEPGEVVVTLLTGRAMPLIRYRMNDVAAWAADSGEPWPMLTTIQGRISDFFVGADGRRLHGTRIMHLLEFMPFILKFQARQVAVDHVIVTLVPRNTGDGPADHADAMAMIEREIREDLGADCRIDISFVADIPPSASGKYRAIISDISDMPR